MKTTLYHRVREIVEAAQAGVARTVNTAQVAANWLIGWEIVEEEQQGKRRAGYGEQLIRDLSVRLQVDFGRGFAIRNLETFRQFYLEYPHLAPIPHALRAEFNMPTGISGTARRKLTLSSEKWARTIPHAPRAFSLERDEKRTPKDSAVRSQSWQPGRLHPNLSWTHYRTLLRVERSAARSFYEIECLQQNWSARELERQIHSLLFERLALSKDKKGLLRLARNGQQVNGPADVFKDPLIMEFLGLPESPRLVESELEAALITNLQAFLLELGKGFAFVARQQRLTLDGDHFYLDLVFYHTILKCYVLVDLKVGKLIHQDLGQLQLYVNYYDEHRRTAGDNPTLGLILCSGKNDAVVRYTLGPGRKNIFARTYKLHLPTEAQLRAELRREWNQRRVQS